MSLRARLALIVGVVLAVMMMIAGGIAIRTTRDTLVGQIDEQVRVTAIRVEPDYTITDIRNQSDDPSPDAGDGAEEPTRFRAIARFVYGPDGSVLLSSPYGFSDDPRSPPELGVIPSDQLFSHINIIRTVPSQDGRLEYRALVQIDDNGNYVVTAVPLTAANEAVDDVRQTLIISGLAGVLVGALVSWAVISREFRPVDRMIRTATEIGEESLDHRIAEPPVHTELGRLSRSLNRMLGRIEESSRLQERVEAKLRQFIADAAHELRTPLTSVRGYAELYRQGSLATPERLAPAMLRIEEEGIRMARLLDEMLLLARLDLHPEDMVDRVDLSVLISEQVAMFQAAGPERELTREIADGIVVRGDADQLRALVGHLMNNIRVHTPAETRVAVRLERDGVVAELRVEDSGPGISAEFQSQVFERFTREDPARTRATGGSGLGLAIASAITSTHGGTIRLESTPGTGSIFVVRIPLIEPEPVQAEP